MFAFCEPSSQRPWRRGPDAYWHWYLLTARPRASEHMHTLLAPLRPFLLDFLTDCFRRRFPVGACHPLPLLIVCACTQKPEQYAPVFGDKLMLNSTVHAPSSIQ